MGKKCSFYVKKQEFTTIDLWVQRWAYLLFLTAYSWHTQRTVWRRDSSGSFLRFISDWQISHKKYMIPLKARASNKDSFAFLSVSPSVMAFNSPIAPQSICLLKKIISIEYFNILNFVNFQKHCETWPFSHNSSTWLLKYYTNPSICANSFIGLQCVLRPLLTWV